MTRAPVGRLRSALPPQPRRPCGESMLTDPPMSRTRSRMPARPIPASASPCKPAAIVGHANDEAGERRIAQAWRLGRRFKLQRRLDPRRARMTERVGHRLLDEAIGHQTRPFAQSLDARVDIERDSHLRIGAAPMRDERLERLEEDRAPRARRGADRQESADSGLAVLRPGPRSHSLLRAQQAGRQSFSPAPPRLRAGRKDEGRTHHAARAL